tara:strand:+ start:22 stop:1905 length:1884 start_codon:yes stop_codon:yes gene_type:complete
MSHGVFGVGYGGFPDALHLAVDKPVDVVFKWTGENLSWLLNPISSGVDALMAGVENLFLWLPWMVVLILASLASYRLGGLSTGLFSAVSLVLIGMWGLWDSAMLTMSMMAVSVVIAVVVGIPIGVTSAMSNRVDGVLRPVLDTMQVLPAFVYLMPALFLFGVGSTVSVFLTVTYAIPPVIRLTNLGLRQIPIPIVETALSHGSSRIQTLFQVQLPLAKPTILMGINQTIMMALAMVIITALVGSVGLGRDVWTALRRIDSGAGFEAGLAIVFIAILFDRLSYALAEKSTAGGVYRKGERNAVPGAGMHALNNKRLPRWLLWSVSGIGIILFVSASKVFNFEEYPGVLQYSIAGFINSFVDWFAINLFFATDWIKESFIREFGLAPVQAFLGWLPWSVIVFGSASIVYFLGGWKVSVLAAASVTFFGIAGVWDLALHTLSQVVVAVMISTVIGVLLGIWASQSRLMDAALRPIMDTMQTMPIFVYLIPVIMLWGSGPITAIIATVIYSIPPAIRMTNMGIRLVPVEIVETAKSHGASTFQVLLHVQIPMAMSTIMMGINQTIIMALAMVIIGGLVGGGGLGEEVYITSIYLRMGQGFIAGMCIVLMAMVLSRISRQNRPWSSETEALR